MDLSRKLKIKLIILEYKRFYHYNELCKMINNRTHFSSCFDEMKNNEESHNGKKLFSRKFQKNAQNSDENASSEKVQKAIKNNFSV